MSIDRINASGASSVQRFYTQRPAQPPKTQAPAAAPLYEFEPLQVPQKESVPDLGLQTQKSPGSGQTKTDPNLPPIAEIQSIAKQAGFVGLSERDIQRAYVLGESLLADYRV